MFGSIIILAIITYNVATWRKQNETVCQGKETLVTDFVSSMIQFVSSGYCFSLLDVNLGIEGKTILRGKKAQGCILIMGLTRQTHTTKRTCLLP